MYSKKGPGKAVRATQYLDGGHQTGQDQPYGTPQSPSQQVLISWRIEKTQEFKKSYIEITEQLGSAHVHVLTLLIC